MGFLSRSTSDDSSAEPTDEPASAGVGRKLLVALAAAAVGYLLVRRLRSDRSRPSLEEVQELTEDVTPGGGSPIPIDEVRELTDDLASEDREVSIDVTDDESAEEATDDGESERGVADDGESEGESLDEDVSDQELEERGEDRIQETPAEPGEMTVDDELVDELVDEQDDAAGDAEANETPNAGEQEDEDETDDEGDDPSEDDDA